MSDCFVRGMPELKETIARLRELLDDCQPRKWTGHCHAEGDVEAKRQVGAKAKFLMAVMDELPTLIKSAEEVENLRADKERLDWLEYHTARTDSPNIESIRPKWKQFSGYFTTWELTMVYGKTHVARTLREAIDQALQTHGQVPESTPEAKQEASPARKEKADA